MKILEECENKHFYYSGKGCLFNTNSENCIAYFKDNDTSKKIQFFESGALITKKTSNDIHISFTRNNNDRIVDIHKTDLLDMSNEIYDINATVYATGILIDVQNYEKKSAYEYILYNGMSFRDTNFDRLKTRVEDYEELIGFYFNKEDRSL